MPTIDEDETLYLFLFRFVFSCFSRNKHLKTQPASSTYTGALQDRVAVRGPGRALSLARGTTCSIGARAEGEGARQTRRESSTSRLAWPSSTKRRYDIYVYIEEALIFVQIYGSRLLFSR